MKRQRPPLWIVFVLSIFFIFVATSIVVFLIAALLLHLELMTVESPLIPIAALMTTCVIVGTLVSSFMGRRVLAPVTRLSRAAREVAKGNFNVKLEEDTKVREIREMAGDFNAMVRELGSIETLREDFVVSVSHEFKTPLAAIEGYATLLQDEALTPEDRREYTATIISSARQLSTLTGNILKLSKLENQAMVADKRTFRLDEQIREVILLLEPQWSAKALELNLDLLNTTYYGSPDLLHQVWHNLLDNAVKFTPPGGEISVRMTCGQGEISIAVADTGQGIGGEDLPHIFDKFYQGDTSRVAEGNGLGLSLVRRIVQLCGGDIRVESRPGHGSTFTVTLPAEPAAH